MRKYARLLAIDPSLTRSGWSLFCMGSGEPLSWGTLAPTDKKSVLSERLNSLHQQTESLFNDHDLASSDFLVCEGPAPVSLNPSSAIKVEQVRGIFEGIARTRGLTVPGRLNPRTVQTELFGLRGKQLPRAEVKKIARSILIQMYSYSEIFKNAYNKISQDEVDALLIGTLAKSKIQHSLATNSPIHLLFEGGNSKKQGRRMRWSAKNLTQFSR